MTISISWNIDHHSCLAVPQYNKIAVQQGMRAWQLLLDWYTPAERNPVTSCAVALCREVQWVTGKTHNWKNMIISLPSSPWPLKDTYHSRLGWGGVLGEVSWWFLIITCQVLPHDLWDTYHYHLGRGGLGGIPLKDTYCYHWGWGGVCGEYPDNSSSLHDNDNDDGDGGDDDDYDDGVACVSRSPGSVCESPRPHDDDGDDDDVVVVDDDNDHCESGQTMASDRASTTASTSNGSNSNN